MAIAPFEETSRQPENAQPALRLVAGGRRASAPPRGAAIHAAPLAREVPRRSRDAHPSAQRPVAGPRDARVGAPLLTGKVQAAARPRQMGLSVQARRRRAAGLVVTLASVALLALPIRALGGVTVAGQATPGAVPAGLAPGSVIVVQQGDTIHSLALRINPGAVTQTAGAIVAEVGSRTLVPGEHVVVP